MDLKVNKYTFSREEVDAVEKALGITLSDRNKDLLQDNRYSEMIDDVPDPGNKSLKRPAKIHLSRLDNGEVIANYFFQKETLFIPDRIGNHLLSKDEKQCLKEGQTIQFKNNRGENTYVQIDKELNGIIVKGDRELDIPKVIGQNQKYGYDGYVLTNQDQIDLANKKILSPKVLCGEFGYFLSSFGMSNDNKGYVFIDYQTIPSDKVAEYIEKYNSVTKVSPESKVDIDKPFQNSNEQSTGKERTNTRDMDKEFTDAFNRRDFKKINDLANEGYKPAAEQLQKILSTPDLNEHDKIALCTIFNVEGKSASKDENYKQNVSTQINKNEGKTNVVIQENKDHKRENNVSGKLGNVLNQAFNQM